MAQFSGIVPLKEIRNHAPHKRVLLNLFLEAEEVSPEPLFRGGVFPDGDKVHSVSPLPDVIEQAEKNGNVVFKGKPEHKGMRTD